MLFRKESPFTCNICGIGFTRKDNMKRHIVRIHETIWKDSHTIETRTVCHFPSCNETYYQKTSFLKHLKEKHRFSIEVEENTFASEGDFLVWKEKQETEQLVYFSKQTGKSQETIVNYFTTVANMTVITNRTEQRGNPRGRKT